MLSSRIDVRTQATVSLQVSRYFRSSRLPVEKRSDWAFELNADRRWVWHVTHPDGTTEFSEGSFLTAKECIADATHNGYIAWIPEAERRNHPFPPRPPGGFVA